jgi:hypothetical protein
MKKTRRLVLFAILAISGPSFAGRRLEEPVVVNLAGREAYGSIGSARNSADSVQFIGCSLEADSSTDAMVACFASDANGIDALCITSSPRIVAAVQAITAQPFIDFTWDSDGNCTFVFLDTASYNSPGAL